MAHDTASEVAVMRGLTRKFTLAFNDTGVFYPSICTIAPSGGEDEQYGFLGTNTPVREWLGDRVFNRLRAAHFTIVNKHWEDSLEVKKTHIRDDRLGMYGPLMQNLGMQAARHPDELVLDTLVAGNSTACVDGQFFFDTDHDWGNSGTQDNDLTAAIVAAASPTETEFRAAWSSCREAIIGFKADNGKPFMQPIVGPLNDMLLLCPVAMQEIATQALFKALISSGETNIILDRPRILASPFLTGNVFYAFYLGAPLKPMVFQAREPLTRQSKGMNDMEFKEVKFMTEARYNVGYLAWWNAVRYEFT